MRKRSGFVGLLDLLPAPRQVKMAVSWRRLTNKYTGPCALVRRASDDATLDIPFCSEGVICRSTIANFCQGTTGYVRTWYDQSGNGCNADQSTAASQPALFASGDLYRDSQKGLPRMFCNANGILMTFDPTKVPVSSTPSTQYMVYQSVNPGAVRARYCWGTNAGGQARVFEQSSANQPRITNGTTTCNTSTADGGVLVSHAARFARTVNPSETLRTRLDNASNTTETASAHPTTWATGTTTAKIWGRLADNINHVGYVSEFFVVEEETADSILAYVNANVEEYYGFNK